MESAITRNGSQPPAKGPADWFTGTIRIEPLLQPKGTYRPYAATPPRDGEIGPGKDASIKSRLCARLPSWTAASSSEILIRVRRPKLTFG